MPLGRVCLALILGLALVGPVIAQSLADRVAAARAQVAEGDIAEGVASFTAIRSALDPANDAHRPAIAFIDNELSVAHRRGGDHAAAVAAAERATAEAGRLALPPGRQAVYALNASLAALDAGDLRLASRFAASAAAHVEADPEPAVTVAVRVDETRARVALALGQVDAAEDGASAALSRITPDDPIWPQIALLNVEVALAARDLVGARTALDQLSQTTAITLDLADRRSLNEARVAILEGRFSAAEDTLTRLVDQDGPIGTSALYNLAEVEFMRGRLAEASLINDRTEARLATSPNPVLLAQTAHRRALIAQELGDLEVAQGHFDTALARFDDALPEDHPLPLLTRSEHVQLLSKLGRFREALDEGAEVVRLAADPQIPAYDRLLMTASLGLAQHAAGQGAEAKASLERVQALRSGGDFPTSDEPPGLLALAEIYLTEDRPEDALRAVDRAIAIQSRAGIETVDRLGESTRIRAMILASQGQRDAAILLAQQNIDRALSRLQELALIPTYSAEFAPVNLRRQVAQFLDLNWGDGSPSPEATDRMFQAAQLVHLTEAARATNGVLRDLGSSDSAVGRLLDRRAQLTRDALATSRLLSEQAGADVTDASEQLEQLLAELRQVDRDLTAEAPELVESIVPQALSVAQVQAALRPGEALWLQLTTEDVSYGFWLTQDSATMRRTPLGAERLSTLVRQIRDTVDVQSLDQIQPFAFEAAERLFDLSVGAFREELEATSKIVLVPDLAAQQISFATLVRSAPDLPSELGAGDPVYRFLGLSHALTNIPSPQSLVQLRQLSSATDDTGRFIGFGDPVLNGDGTPGTRGITDVIDRITGLAIPEAISRLYAPLPDSALELRSMAEVGSEPALFLQDAATEAQVKRTEFSGIRTIAFATHAAVVGEFDQLREPALILTPPSSATSADDGLLTVSEISRLSLDADLVILSACNTGSAAGRAGAPGLSGLASGFFRAGAESLLVSHWNVLSFSAALLIPDFYRRFEAGETDDPSEALRLAMIGLANSDIVDASHPAHWAAFTMVGG